MIDTNPQTFILLVDQVTSGKSVKMDTYFGSGSKELYSSAQNIDLNSWNHYCGLRQGSTSRLYLDGILIQEGPNYGGSNKLQPTAWLAGAYNGVAGQSSGQFFVHGSLCGMRIYD